MKISVAINADIKAVIGISKTYIKNLIKIAKGWGFNNTKNLRILNIYLKDKNQLEYLKKRISTKIQ